MRTAYVLLFAMAISASALRSDVYNILDRVLESGDPVIIERNGRKLKIVAVEQVTIFDRLVEHPGFVVGDSDDFVEMDWSHEWRPDPA